MDKAIYTFNIQRKVSGHLILTRNSRIETSKLVESPYTLNIQSMLYSGKSQTPCELRYICLRAKSYRRQCPSRCRQREHPFTLCALKVIYMVSLTVLHLRCSVWYRPRERRNWSSWIVLCGGCWGHLQQEYQNKRVPFLTSSIGG